LLTPGSSEPPEAMGVPFWVNATAKGALISKLVALVTEAPLPTLLGVLALPASSNSTVKEKF